MNFDLISSKNNHPNHVRPRTKPMLGCLILCILQYFSKWVAWEHMQSLSSHNMNSNPSLVFHCAYFITNERHKWTISNLTLHPILYNLMQTLCSSPTTRHWSMLERNERSVWKQQDIHIRGTVSHRTIIEQNIQKHNKLALLFDQFISKSVFNC